MKLNAPRVLLLAATALAAAGAHAQEKFTYMTNWYAQAEHGGFYQALAAGLYKKEGLDVSIKMGGPQVNGMQLLAAGQTDCFMGYDVQTIKAREQGINAVSVGAAFQKDPQVMIGHPENFKKMEDLKGKTILISADARTTVNLNGPPIRAPIAMHWPPQQARNGVRGRGRTRRLGPG